MLNYKIDIMDNNIKNSFKTYSKKLWLNFDEVTIISPKCVFGYFSHGN